MTSLSRTHLADWLAQRSAAIEQANEAVRKAMQKLRQRQARRALWGQRGIDVARAQVRSAIRDRVHAAIYANYYEGCGR